MTAYKCPNCAALLVIHGGRDLVKCEYCGSLINLERKGEDTLAKHAHELAQKTREYKLKYAEINEAKERLNSKTSALSEIIKGNNDLTRNTILYSVIIWIAVCFAFSAIINNLIYKYDFFNIILKIAIWGGSAYLTFKNTRSLKEKKVKEYKERMQQAQLQENYAKEKYVELCEGFDESFIPVEVRNDTALNYIINALETEKAYTIKQAIEQWREYSGMEEKLQEANRHTSNGTDIDSKDKSNAEVIGAFTGAALGAFGGAVARETIREIKKHL